MYQVEILRIRQGRRVFRRTEITSTQTVNQTRTGVRQRISTYKLLEILLVTEL